MVALAALWLGEPSTPPPRGGTSAARPPLQPMKAPVFTFEMVVVPLTMTRRETDFLLEPQPERARAATASRVSARSAFSGAPHMRSSLGRQATGPSAGPVFRNDP